MNTLKAARQVQKMIESKETDLNLIYNEHARIKETTLETSEEDVDKTTLETSEEDIGKTALETSEGDVGKTALETSKDFRLMS